MNDITRARARRLVDQRVADGTLIRYGDGKIIEADRRLRPPGRDITPDWEGYSGPAIFLEWTAGSAGVARADNPHVPDPWVLVPTGLLRRLAEASTDPGAAEEALALAAEAAS